MSKSSSLMDTEPGGEQTQYEGQKTFTEPKSNTSTSRVADSTADLQTEDQKQERGEKTAENIRYGEAISEHGFGGETTGNTGSAGRGGGYGGVKDETEDVQQSRREQGYGGGNDVGA